MNISNRYTYKENGKYGEVLKINPIRIVTDACIALAVLIMLSMFWPLRSVPTGSRGVITQYGEIRGIEQEGLHFVPPWQSLQIFNTRAESATVEGAEGSTSDQQPVNVSMTVRYSIDPSKVAEVYEKYSHDGDLSNYVQTAVQEVFKTVTAKYTAPDLIAKRGEVSAAVFSNMQSALSIYGARVIKVDMRNFAFSKSYLDAINQKVTQEQLRLAAENKLKTVESEQKQKVAIAEAEANAAKAKADGEAYAQLKVATAQADALKIQNAALAQNKDVLELRRIEVQMEWAKNWKGDLPQNVYGSAPIPLVNVPK